MQHSQARGTGAELTPAWLWGVLIIALLFGLYGRFAGLGLWPLGVDEFYISRSIDNVLRSGLPEFACGGYYTRGIAYQYIVAGLRIEGLTPEFAGRVVTAISSLCVLPAVYWLGKRLRNPVTGLIAVILILASVWEIEMARFARMYAPFQAVFAWYLVFFLRYVADGEKRAMWGMVLLSILGVMTWEGGALIGLLNLLPPFITQRDGKLKARDFAYLFGMGSLFVVLYLATKDLRGFSDIPTLPETASLSAPISAAAKPKFLLVTLSHHLAWLTGIAIPCLLAAASIAWLWSMRTRWLAALGLLAALGAGIAGQLLLSAGILLLLLLSELVQWHELTQPRARPYFFALLLAAAFWMAFGWLTSDGYSASLLNSKAVWVMRQLVGFPDVIDQIVRPWGGTLPRLSILLGLAISWLIYRAVFNDKSSRTSAVRAMLIVVVVLALAVGAASTPRYETRYTFFLYPLLLVLGIVAVSSMAERLAATHTRAAAVSGITCLALFAISGDFQPRHVATIDTASTNFRVGLSPKLSAHYYPRNDARGLATWLSTQVHSGDMVLSGIPNLDAYYNNINYVYLGTGDNRLSAYACNEGKIDRWTNKPLLYSAASLRPLIARHATLYIVAYPDFTGDIVKEIAAEGWDYRELSPVANSGAHIIIVSAREPYS